ncbi:cysteine peptidase family C39 domain-containing protein [Cyclobacterium salsum]|uniref:cysteine peptidase family C39 domain-containing protein n=1 Tax=Cyclobacterium salsum TaxID=2666329 RepID=UPI001391806F|nr:cysteine peptidase family C39 domain-containing protein [Cyclobacterium salsum]
MKQAQFPLIAHWDKRHFVVVYRIYISLQEIHSINGLIPSKCFSQTEMPFLGFQ